MLGAGEVEVAKAQPALSGFKKGRETDAGTPAKAPGGRKSVLGKEMAMKPPLPWPWGLARL